MHPKSHDGLFITIEGVDGCGKTSLAHALDKELSSRGYQIFRTREPGGTPLSEHLRELLLSPDSFQICQRAEMMLFLTARVQNIHDRILPALHSGKVVICERYNDSTIAYQAYARHLGIEQVEQLCKLACDNLEPDVTLLLDIDPRISLTRVKGEKDRLENEQIHFHEQVRAGYLHLADQHPDRIAVIDAAAAELSVFQQALETLIAHLTIKPCYGKA